MTRRNNSLLSKTRYIAGMQCPRYLWVIANARERIPQPDAGTQFAFDQGHEVGELAKRLFPGGVDIPSEDFAASLRQSRELLSDRVPLFEAAFMNGGKYARVDILQPTGQSDWNIIEVKSSTKVKDVHYRDVAFQKHVCQQAGISIDRCFLAHVNNQYVRNGEILPDEFFDIVDITDEVATLSAATCEHAQELLSTMCSPTCPEAIVGTHCNDPYDCPLREECWDFLPDDNVFSLYRFGSAAYTLLDRGIFSIADLPQEFPLTREQQIQRNCLVDGAIHVEPTAIRSFLRSLEYPVHYLDFETFSTAIPLFDGIRPYQQVPFQFSLHVVQQPGDTPKQYAFLGDATCDPRRELSAALRAAIGSEGCIVAYSKSFEIGVLHALGSAFPEYEVWAEGVCDRMVDLLVPFRGFNYYNPSQRGSASLKRVLPALTGEGYDGLAISDGSLAGLAYLSCGAGMSAEEIQQVRANLLEYCGLDTSGMIQIVEKLTELSHSS
ncbi:MAG: DUF2779 domain-containing protein [Dehalococcoidia bacterium]|nr:DUF2779 domain-containing protein [Dehalococcoidia bacterium]